jgi:hypothetical protein
MAGYAGYLDRSDYNVGRVVKAIEDLIPVTEGLELHPWLPMPHECDQLMYAGRHNQRATDGQGLRPPRFH